MIFMFFISRLKALSFHYLTITNKQIILLIFCLFFPYHIWFAQILSPDPVAWNNSHLIQYCRKQNSTDRTLPTSQWIEWFYNMLNSPWFVFAPNTAFWQSTQPLNSCYIKCKEWRTWPTCDVPPKPQGGVCWSLTPRSTLTSTTTWLCVSSWWVAWFVETQTGRSYQCLGKFNWPTVQCTVLKPSCTFNGVTVLHGQWITWYKAANPPANQTCTSPDFSKFLICQNGVLANASTYPSLSCSDNNSCTFHGKVIPHGGVTTGFKLSMMPEWWFCGGDNEWTLTCQNWNLLNVTTYPHASCTLDQGIDPLPYLVAIIDSYRKNPQLKCKWRLKMNDIADHPYKMEIETMINNCAMIWYLYKSWTPFKPSREVSRGEFFMTVARLMNLWDKLFLDKNRVTRTNFVDLPLKISFLPYINRLQRKWFLDAFIVVKSKRERYIDPDKPITHKEIRTFMEPILISRGQSTDILERYGIEKDADDLFFLRGEVPPLMIDIFAKDGYLMMGYNVEFLEILVEKIRSYSIPQRRSFLTRLRQRIEVLSYEDMYAMHLDKNSLQRDIDDALAWLRRF